MDIRKTISFDEKIRVACPNLVSGVIQCSVKNSTFNIELWNEITEVSKVIRSERIISEDKNIPTIKATRDGYKKCGKDPNRYRPSAEQLNRRLLQGKELYQISTLVDLVNLVSMQSGYSIGGFDADKIEGNIVYGIGEENEPYKGIGRGQLNIEGLPVLRDTIGGIGTPTSDEERTMLNLNTIRFLMNVNAYNGNSNQLKETLDWSVALLEKYVDAKELDVQLFV